MARKSSWNQLAFNSFSPARILLMVSVVINIILAGTLAYMDSKEGDGWVGRFAVSHICERDYDWQISQLNQSGQSTDGLKQFCRR